MSLKPISYCVGFMVEFDRVVSAILGTLSLQGGESHKERIELNSVHNVNLSFVAHISPRG